MIKNRVELAKYFNELGFTSGAEIGVCSGRYSEILCQSMLGLQLLAIDSWANIRNIEKEEEKARKKLATYNVVIIKSRSMDAVKDVQDNSLDFVFIDAGHDYDSVKGDVAEWSKKVKVGGIVSGHDYYVFPNSGNRGVIDAVDEYVKTHNLKLFTTSWDKRNHVSDDRQPCWYFFKK